MQEEAKNKIKKNKKKTRTEEGKIKYIKYKSEWKVKIVNGCIHTLNVYINPSRPINLCIEASLCKLQTIH